MAGNNLQQVTPFVHAHDVAAMVCFFVDRLGFTAAIHKPDYAYVHREGVGFRIFQLQPGTSVGDRRWAYYIDVEDVDAVEAELRPRLTDLPEGDVYGSVNQGYGQREFMVVMPDGLVLVYGQPIWPAASTGEE